MSARYGVDPAYVAARLVGEDEGLPRRRNALDWFLIVGTTTAFVGFALIARPPALTLAWAPAAVLTLVLLGFLVVGGRALWRATRLG